MPLRPLRRDLGLAGPSTGALTRHDRAAHQQLAAPYAPRFPALKRAGQAGNPSPAATAHGLRLLHIPGRFGEEQFRFLGARKVKPTGSVAATNWPATLISVSATCLTSGLAWTGTDLDASSNPVASVSPTVASRHCIGVIPSHSTVWLSSSRSLARLGDLGLEITGPRTRVRVRGLKSVPAGLSRPAIFSWRSLDRTRCASAIGDDAGHVEELLLVEICRNGQRRSGRRPRVRDQASGSRTGSNCANRSWGSVGRGSRLDPDARNGTLDNGARPSAADGTEHVCPGGTHA